MVVAGWTRRCGAPAPDCIPWPDPKAMPGTAKKRGPPHWRKLATERGFRAPGGCRVRLAGADVDERGVSKTVYVVGGIGAVGCLMLSFMMQHLLKVQSERSHSPVADELKETCAEHLVGAIDV